jgi:toxin-antitoxin system PIN domain toxin
VTSGAALLDVNVLIALAWPIHVHHQPARDWFRSHGRSDWATTPMTEAGFVRVSSNRKAISDAVTPAEAIVLLDRLCKVGKHEFWSDAARLVDAPFDLTRLATSRQVTDAHLVAVAIQNGGHLATFDRGVPELLEPAKRTAVELLSGP